MKSAKRVPKVVVIDEYVDDPAALGVLPYISPMIRAVADATKDAEADVEYTTVDMLRREHPVPDADVSAVLSGTQSPGNISA